MSFLPEDELKGRIGLNLSPMIDFLFLMLMFFATAAVSRITTKDTNIQLVEIKPETGAVASQASQDYKVIHLNINASGQYQWVSDVQSYHLAAPEEIAKELLLQYEKGLLPQDKSNTHVLLKIDKHAQWEPILKALFAIREAGFEARPVYEPEPVADNHPLSKSGGSP